MTNEIKEKIEYLKKFAGIYEGAMITEIEDYIINLQKSQETLIKNDNEIITNLQEKYKEADKSYTKMIYEYNKVLSRNEKAIQYINKYEYQRYCPSPYEKEKYIMREEKEGQDLLNILRGDE